MSRIETRARAETYERTKRSRFSHLGFLGLNFMNLLKRTWATGAMPLRAGVSGCRRDPESSGTATYMGAPGCPELLWKVASTCGRQSSQYVFIFAPLVNALVFARARLATGELTPESQRLRRWRGKLGGGVAGATYREEADGVDGLGVNLAVTHDC